MNAVEIEEALTQLFESPFDPDEFPFEFLRAFGNKDTTIARLRPRKDTTNKSPFPNGLLQRKNIHLLVCEPGQVHEALNKLRTSPDTKKHQARFVLATDGITVQAEDLKSADGFVTCDFRHFPDHFGTFLPLAGIEMVAEIKDNAVDIRAANRLRRLYTVLFQSNPEWASVDRSEEMNHFMARLIFCFFAEDTQIFGGDAVFSRTIQEMTEHDGSNVHDVLSILFEAMNTPRNDTDRKHLPRWAHRFPYVNGGLFGGTVEVPHFTRTARSYLIELGHLQWTHINPDIFGSMIQVIADPDERSLVGMHYTSVPNILKVLNPLFLNDLRAQLEAAGDNARKLLNLRKRIARIRVFDPACGAGNFLVIAYKQLREIEAIINERRGEKERISEISPLNFRGIEIGHFACEIARLSLIIARYQCDALYRGQLNALNDFLPLEKENWIVCGNALRLDWKSVCPPTGSADTIQTTDYDLFAEEISEVTVDFDNEGGETYICGNPPYLGSTNQTAAQKSDMDHVFKGKITNYKSLDYVTAWFMRAAEYQDAAFAFVTTNSICQGQSVARLWPPIFEAGFQIHFAYPSFKWENLAAHNAGVTVSIVGLSPNPPPQRVIYTLDDENTWLEKQTEFINAYLIAAPNVFVETKSSPLSADIAIMTRGNQPTDGGHLLLSYDEKLDIQDSMESVGVDANHLIRRIYGSKEFIRGEERYCLWIVDQDHTHTAESVPAIRERIERVRAARLKSTKKQTQSIANTPHKFGEIRQKGDEQLIVIPAISSENRPYLPIGILSADNILSNKCFGLFDAPLWNLALLSSRLHLVWIATVCVRLEMRFSYSNTLGWNTFPVPTLTEKNKADLTRGAEQILLAREAHFPKTIADLYDGKAMPDDLIAAHDYNDEIVDRIFIGRRFRNDTERLEVLFARYAEEIARKHKKPTLIKN